MRVTRRLRGKLHTVLEKLNHGHHAMRIYCKKLVGRMYEKFRTFLRVEVCLNPMKDLGLNKGLENLQRLRQKLVAITDRFAGFEAQSLNVHAVLPARAQKENGEQALRPTPRLIQFRQKKTTSRSGRQRCRHRSSASLRSSFS